MRQLYFCPVGANELIGREATVDEILCVVRKDKIFYKTSNGGMTLSGGEPSMQSDFALDLIKRAKEEGISSSVETCGIGARAFYEAAADLDVTFLFDIKCLDSDKHCALTGVRNEKILENLVYLLGREADVIIRMPLIPGINDTDKDIQQLCDFLKENEGKYRYAEVMPYHAFGISKSDKIGKAADYLSENATQNDKDRWKEIFLSHGIDVKIS